MDIGEREGREIEEVEVRESFWNVLLRCDSIFKNQK